VATMSVLGQSAKASVDKVIATNFTADLVVSNAIGQPFSPSIADDVAAIDGVSAVTPVRYAPGSVDGRDDYIGATDPAQFGDMVTLDVAGGSLEDFVEGTVLIDDQSIYEPGVDVVQLRRRVGMVFQKSNPFPKSIFENVAYGLRINGLVKTRAELEGRVEESLHQAAIWDEVKDRLQESALALSGGQQQRLCIARALAIRPEILLMDEPASALDPIATQRIEELIYELKKKYTIVIVTHNMQQAARVSDQTAFFWLGRLVEFDRTDKIFTAPAEKLTEDYVTGRCG